VADAGETGFVSRGVGKSFLFNRFSSCSKRQHSLATWGVKVQPQKVFALPISCVMCAEMEAPGHSERRKSERPLRQGRRKGWLGAGAEGTPPWYCEYKNGNKYLISKCLIESKYSGRGDITPLIAEVRWGQFVYGSES